MLQHLFELRDRILHSLFLLCLVFFACYYYSNPIYEFVSQPILKYAAPNTQIITTQVTAPFMVPIQLSFFLALLVCAPYFLYQIWVFVRPGLYKHERNGIAPVVLLSTGLFYTGIAFAVFVVCPVAIRFFTNCAPKGVTVMLDIGNYLDFIVTICVGSGIAFQIPIVTALLIRSGLISKQQLSNKRKHVIVLTLIIGMLLAPPDVFSQLLLAIPMWGLFEVGLLFSK